MGEDQALALALEGRIQARGETAELVSLAGALAALPDPEIDARFAAMLEQRLLTDGLDVTAGPVLTLVRSIPETPADEAIRTADIVQMPRRRMVVRRGLVAGVVAASMAAFPLVAAASALPGTPFYSVKKAIERVEITFAGSNVSRGLDYAKFAQTRMSEATQMVAIHDDPTLIAATIGEARDDLQRAKDLVIGHTNNAAILNRFAGIASATAQDIRSIDGPMTTQVREQVAGALQATQQIQQAVAQALGLPVAVVTNTPDGLEPLMSTAPQSSSSTQQGTSAHHTDSQSGDQAKTSSSSNGAVASPSGNGQAETDAKNAGCAVPGSANGIGDLTAPVVRALCD